MNYKPRIAIVGTGMSGLACANLLKDEADVTLFEKSRGVGGRLATRTTSSYHFDHGAQYFQAVTPQFQTFLAPLIADKVVLPWEARVVALTPSACAGPTSLSSESPHYVGVPAMKSIGHYLARTCDITFSKHITSLTQTDRGWQLCDKEGETYDGYDWVIVTAPLMQARDLLPSSFAYYSHFKRDTMTPCFCLMLGYTSELSLDFDCAHVTESDVAWISVNSHKPGRRSEYTLIVQASHQWSQENLMLKKEAVIQHLLQETRAVVKREISHFSHVDLHLWRYANSPSKKSFTPLVDPALRLAACGDWSLGEGVESAFLSAHQTVRVVQDIWRGET